MGSNPATPTGTAGVQGIRHPRCAVGGTYSIRFLDAAAVSSFLSGASLRIAEQIGDWDRSPLTAASPEIIIMAVDSGADHVSK